MPQLSELYDGDKVPTRSDIRDLRATVMAPHPLHGVRYSDGVVLCGRGSCEPCRDFRAKGLDR